MNSAQAELVRWAVPLRVV